MFGSRGNKLKQYLVKGTKVIVSGSFKAAVKGDKTYLNVTVNELDLVTVPKSEDAPKTRREGKKVSDEEIPY